VNEAGNETAHRELAPYVLLTALFVAVILIVPPRGDFPLNDDWIYAKVVENLLDSGNYVASPYADPTFIAQGYWGAAFASLLEFNFENLRLSTLVLALGSVWSTCWAAREAGVNRNGALLAGAVLLANPIFLNVSYTFMTDVPFLCFATLSGAAFLRYLRTDGWIWLLTGNLLAIAAFFIRQFGVLPVAALAPLLFIGSGAGWTTPSLKALATCIVPWLVAAAFYALAPVGGLGAGTGWDWNALGTSVPERAVAMGRSTSVGMIYLALFATPLFFAVQPQKALSVIRSRPGATVGAVLVAAVFGWLTATDGPPRLPYVGNVWYDLGVGPLLMPGMVEGREILAPVQLRMGWWAPTAFAIACAAIAFVLAMRTLGRLVRSEGERGEARVDIYLILWAAAMLWVVALPAVAVRFDRYFLMALPPAAIFLMRRLGPQIDTRGYATAAMATGAMYLFGVVALQDYLAWNRARWEALEHLVVDRRVPIERINGGYEFNGWIHSDRYAEESRREGRKVFGPLGWWIVRDDYSVGLRPRERFEVIGAVPYYSWLGFETREMLIQRRTERDPWPYPDL